MQGRSPESAPAPDVVPDVVAIVDVSALRCPMTWVRTKVALARLADGAELEILLSDGEMLRNVPLNARDDGHDVRSLVERAPGLHVLRLRKNARPSAPTAPGLAPAAHR